MNILIGIVVLETTLIGLTLWSTRRVPARSRARLARYIEDLPHAL